MTTAQTPFIRLRGLPFSATEEDIKSFFGEIQPIRSKIVLGVNGRATGEAYVEFDAKENAGKSLEFDRKEMKGRYIEVFTATFGEGEGAFKATVKTEADDGTIVRLRGLPFACNETDIKTFFDGLETSEIVIEMGGPRGKPTGEAFVRFNDADGALKAMDYNNKHIGSRYVEVFKSTQMEMNRAKGLPVESIYAKNGIKPLMSLEQQQPSSQPPPHAYHQQPPRNDWQHHGGYGGGGSGGGPTSASAPAYPDPYGYGASYAEPPQAYGGGYGGGGGADGMQRVYMRGLPFDADARSIEGFLSPLRVGAIKMGVNESNRPSGDAIVEFSTYEEVQAALAKNNQRMGKRYIELFSERDVPGNMKRLLWRDANNPVGAPQLDSQLNGWGGRAKNGGGGGGGGSREYGRGDGWGRGGGGGARGRPPPPPPHREDAWGAYGYGSGGGGYDQHNQHGGYQGSYGGGAGYNPYGNDRQRESHGSHDSAAPSWGGWAPGQSDYSSGGGYQ